VVTFDNSANSFSGSFSGNGASISNVNALTLGGLPSSDFWRLDGNNVSASQFLGTTNNQALEIWVNNTRALRIEPSSAPSLVGGYFQNNANGYAAVVIAGGGTSGSLNQALGNYAFVGAGHGGQAGSFSAVVDGGYNVSPRQFSFIGSGLSKRIWRITLHGSGTNNRSRQPQASASAADRTMIQTNSIDGRLLRDKHIGANAGAATIGGFLNLIQANAGSSTIGGGWANVIQSNSGYNTLGGGLYNTIGGNYGTPRRRLQHQQRTQRPWAGGYSTSSGLSAGGGGQNISSGDFATVGGGEDNSSSSHSSTVGGQPQHVAAATLRQWAAVATTPAAIRHDGRRWASQCQRRILLNRGRWNRQLRNWTGLTGGWRRLRRNAVSPATERADSPQLSAD
jgi:hypothetical protein